MSVTIAEHLSSVLDGEAGEFEQRRILDELGDNETLASSLSCYALIGETMRNEKQSGIAGSDFLKGIHDEIHKEPDYSEVQLVEKKVSNAKVTWIRPVAGFAMAASVAAVAVIGMQSYVLTGHSDATNLAQQPTKITPSMITENTYNYPDKKTNRLYKRYLDEHVKYASTTPIMSSARMVSYSANY